MRLWPQLALEIQNVLPEVIGEANDGKLLARRHHPPIIASKSPARPYSTEMRRILYSGRRCKHRGVVSSFCVPVSWGSTQRLAMEGQLFGPRGPLDHA
jgi:hypothetical protein